MTLAQEKDDRGLLINIFNKPRLKPVLGRIYTDNAEVDITCRPAANNTRWIFDIENASGDITVQLLEHRSKLQVYPDLLSIALLPCSIAFYDAKPFVQNIQCGVFTLRHVKDAPLCSYRVAVDVLHSATR